jgi:hypothetical protein
MVPEFDYILVVQLFMYLDLAHELGYNERRYFLL